ncbi:MAG: alpha/beta fold hydrolase [Rubrivivax sp.]
MMLQVRGRAAYAYTGGKPCDPTRPTVVFVHGALHDHSCWNLLARWCAHHGYAVLALDLPGHGRSEGPPCTDIEQLAQWVLELLDAAGVGSASLVGHSMGSLTVLEAAARAPERAERLVLMGTAYPMQVSESLLATARDDPLRAIDLVNSWSYSSIAAKPSFPGPCNWLHGGNRALMRRNQAGWRGGNLFHLEFSMCDRYRGGEAAAARVQGPVACILGEADQMTPTRSGRALAKLLGATLHTVPAGHNLMVEAPAEVLAALRAALAMPRAAIAQVNRAAAPA